MKTRLLPLALALLAGCTPPEPSPSPTPEPEPAPVAGLDFDAFLGEANERRRAIIETEAALDISQWTPDFTEQNDTYTEEEMELLLTPHDLAEPLTIETAQKDIEAFFQLLRTTYGAYEYFGGDEVFGPLKEQVLAQVADYEGVFYVHTIQDLLADALIPVVQDGHFAIGGQSLIELHRVYMYYVPDLYLSDVEGLDPDYPHTGLSVYFGTGLNFCEDLDNKDGTGYLPDLWVDPPDALDAAARLCDYYGLK